MPHMMSNEARYLLASIVESSQDSVVTIDLDRIITSWNKGAEHLYGYTAEEVIGRPLSIVMLPKDIEDLIRKVNDIIFEITVPIYETVRVHKNGRHTDLEIMLSPVRDPEGRVVGVSTIARDITLRKLHEHQKDEFISIASHELKTPVTGIKAYAEIILDHFERSGDKAAAAIIKKLCGQVDRLADLVGSLLDTTKLTAGELPLERELFDLNTLIREQLDVFMLVSAKDRYVFRSCELAQVYADRKLIGQVLTNLISNAAKYSPEGGEIIITTTATADGAAVSVQDFGIGIPAGVKDKVFDRYFRVSEPQVSAVAGVGLGLYITAGIIRQHGGTISVESEEGKGSTFRFTLPYRK